jgi:hypothetical protein
MGAPVHQGKFVDTGELSSMDGASAGAEFKAEAVAACRNDPLVTALSGVGRLKCYRFVAARKQLPEGECQGN